MAVWSAPSALGERTFLVRMGQGHAALGPASDCRNGWLFTRHGDVAAILRDRSTFVAEVGADFVGRRDVVATAPGRASALIDRATATAPGVEVVVQRVAREAARAAVARSVTGEHVDLVKDVADAIASSVVCAVVGIAATHQSRMCWLGALVREHDDPGMDSVLELVRPWETLCSEVRTMLSPNERLDDVDALASAAALTLVAGFTTIRDLLAGALFAFADVPEQMILLQRKPQLTPNAVEELVRWTTPIRVSTRTAITDVVVGSARVRVGDRVVASLACANADADVFGNPAGLDITRPLGGHVRAVVDDLPGALGDAPRVALGALLDELIPVLGAIELDTGPLRSPAAGRSTFVRMPGHLIARTVVS
jgi:cytochrome P450